MNGRRTATLAGCVLVTLLSAACSGSSSGPGDTPNRNSITGTINVFAAASLTEAFTTLGKRFASAHPGVKVVFNFGPSSGLAEQIGQGAPADVFASASAETMDQLVAAGDATSSTPFVKNLMEVAVPSSNPAHVSSLYDLDNSGVKVALCQADVPCGATAAEVFANAKLSVKAVTEEVDVKSVLSKVELGEVDAGVVYVTDVKAAGSKAKGVVIPADVNASTTYPIATVTEAPNSATAQAFVSYVLSSAGLSVLTTAGFERP